MEVVGKEVSVTVKSVDRGHAWLSVKKGLLMAVDGHMIMVQVQDHGHTEKPTAPWLRHTWFNTTSSMFVSIEIPELTKKA